MDSVQSDNPPNSVRKPFYFNTSAHPLLIGREWATNPSELLYGLSTCSEPRAFVYRNSRVPTAWRNSSIALT